MSAITWTQEDLLSDLEVINKKEVWRIVEAQHLIATATLVDSLSEQNLLENILEETKPPLPEGVEGLPYLLSTPFRYRAVAGATDNDKGSRFRAAGQTEGVFYCSDDPQTCAYEAAFYKALFFSEAPGLKAPASGFQYSAFSTTIASKKVLNLTSHPKLSLLSNIWEDPANYTLCQKLADDARIAQVEIIAYKSVRDPKSRINYAVLTPKAFVDRKEINRRSWHFMFKTDAIYMFCEAPNEKLEMSQEVLSNDPRLARKVLNFKSAE